MKTLILFFTLTLSAPLWAMSTVDQNFMKCSRNADLNCMKIYLERGANIFAKSKGWKRTALHWAIFHKKPEVIRFLIEQNNTIEHLIVADEDRYTPLHYAAMEGSAEITQLLLQELPDFKYILIKNDRGNTPINLSFSFSDSKTQQLFISQLPSLKYIINNNTGDIALHRAAFFENTQTIQTIKWLINQLPTADHILALDKEGNTPFDLALQNENFSAARVIFGNSPLAVKKQLLKSCHTEHELNVRKVCEELTLSLENHSSFKKESYL